MTITARLCGSSHGNRIASSTTTTTRFHCDLIKIMFVVPRTLPEISSSENTFSSVFPQETSPQYFHVNFGFNVTLWDRLHGTLRQKDKIYRWCNDDDDDNLRGLWWWLYREGVQNKRFFWGRSLPNLFTQPPTPGFLWYLGERKVKFGSKKGDFLGDLGRFWGVWTLFGNQPPHPLTFGRNLPKLANTFYSFFFHNSGWLSMTTFH